MPLVEMVSRCVTTDGLYFFKAFHYKDCRSFIILYIAIIYSYKRSCFISEIAYTVMVLLYRMSTTWVPSTAPLLTWIIIVLLWNKCKIWYQYFTRHQGECKMKLEFYLFYDAMWKLLEFILLYSPIFTITIYLFVYFKK